MLTTIIRYKPCYLVRITQSIGKLIPIFSTKDQIRSITDRLTIAGKNGSIASILPSRKGSGRLRTIFRYSNWSTSMDADGHCYRENLWARGQNMTSRIDITLWSRPWGNSIRSQAIKIWRWRCWNTWSLDRARGSAKTSSSIPPMTASSQENGQERSKK